MKGMRKLFTWVVGPTVVGAVGQALGGMAGVVIGSVVGIFVGWWAGRRWFS
ncbi:MAG: hypothetical protein Q8Q85_08335 [Gemmatimonadales bacterium]|nr:hypothetical protein [Gemmatimonadales bacterium]